MTRLPALEPVANAISAIGLTVPSFALLGPAAAGARHRFGPPSLAVTFYAVLPILRNAVVGLQGVDSTWWSRRGGWA